MDGEQLIREHREAGCFFQVDETTSFVREAGSGTPVVCMHGVPTSSFLYRKLLDALAREGMAGMAFDLPGLGLADRPTDFDYSWTGLGRFSASAIDSLNLDEFHLVVHDIGGPVGFEVAAQYPDAIRSLTLLNTIVRVDEFRPPWFMEAFRYPVVGPVWLKSMMGPMFRMLAYRVGVKDRTAMTASEVQAHYELLKRDDGGSAFLDIMRGFELTAQKRERYVSTLRAAEYHLQVIWGRNDPVLSLSPYGETARRVTEVETIKKVSGRHFVQEEQPELIAREISDLSANGERS